MQLLTGAIDENTRFAHGDIRSAEPRFSPENLKHNLELGKLVKKHGFNALYEESPGAHTWLNWRNYLIQFAPQLFQ